MNSSRHHHPHHQHRHHHPHSRPHHLHPAAGSSSSASPGPDVYTPRMRDRQARGKDPYRSGNASDTSDTSELGTRDGPKMRLGLIPGEREDFSKIERREKAAAFLDNPELLMMYAQSTGDRVSQTSALKSTPAARLHFMKMMCGYDQENREEKRKTPSRPTRDTDKRRGGDRSAGR